MAKLARRYSDNAPGEFFVDDTCIDCAACRWVAPASFADSDGHSRVQRQPVTAEERRRALLALVACPTGSIGSTEALPDLAEAKAAFPEPVEHPVYYSGYHSRASYGAASYFIARPEGNLLIDCPRWSSALVASLEKRGGVDLMFLTHRDDVAEHAKFSRHFGCRRVLHRADLERDTAGVELVLEGDAPIRFDPEVTFLPVPGHTRGSTCLLFRERFLFSGDHLAFEPGIPHPIAFRSVCWYSWARQRASMERLLEFSFEWILPGHGHPGHRPKAEMTRLMRDCVAWMA
jgi:glyoxylase-like metal-dependent hydrolase (beta-lactamase superfamily II)/ferredoxin